MLITIGAQGLLQTEFYFECLFRKKSRIGEGQDKSRNTFFPCFHKTLSRFMC